MKILPTLSQKFKPGFAIALTGLALVAGAAALAPAPAEARVFVGVGLGVPLYAYPPPVYYAPPPVYYAPPPTVVYAPAPAPVQMQQNTAAQNWYYCDASKSYYPHVSACPTGWREVAPTPQR